MIEKVVNITVNQKGADKAKKQVDQLNTSLNEVKETSGQLGRGMRTAGNEILNTALQSEKLNEFTGGLTSTISQAVDTTSAFSGSLNIVTGAQKLYTLVVGGTTGALKALRIAIAATGIGLLVVGLGFLLEKLANAKSVTDLLSEAQEKYNLILERTNKLLKDNISALDFQSKSATIRAKILGKGEEELFEIQQKYSKKQLDALGKDYDEKYKKASDFRKNTKSVLLKINEEEAKAIMDYPIYYVDTPGTVKEIANTIQFFQNTLAKGKWLVVVLDHTLLIRGAGGESERGVIVDLEKELMAAKKVGKTSVIQISQMNRNIESPERLNNNALHYPQRSDLSSSDAVFQASDYIIVIHRPEVLGLLSYGHSNLPVKDCIYLHIIKNREGEVKILKFINDLKYNNLKEPEDEEVDPTPIQKTHKEK